MANSENGWAEFIESCASMPNKSSLKQFFDLFLTPEEKNDLAMRFLIVKALLQQEKTQRQIAKDLKVSIAKITRGSNELKRMEAFINEIKEKLIK